MSSFASKSVFRLACAGLLFGLLSLVGGCNKKPRSVEHAEVSGKVLFQGKPLPGGRVSFVTVQGGFAANAVIKEDGTYQIKAPVGEVTIAVDNTMLRPQSNMKGGPERQKSHPSRPGAEKGKEEPIKGQWVKIPAQYMNAGKSGLTYTVTKGPQTHNIELSENPSPPPDE